MGQLQSKPASNWAEFIQSHADQKVKSPKWPNEEGSQLLTYGNNPKTRVLVVSMNKQADEKLLDDGIHKGDMKKADKVEYFVVSLQDFVKNGQFMKDEFLEKVKYVYQPTLYVINQRSQTFREAIKVLVDNDLIYKELTESKDGNHFYEAMNIVVPEQEPVVRTFSVVSTDRGVKEDLSHLLRINKANIPNNKNTRVLIVSGTHGDKRKDGQGNIDPVGGQSGLSDECYLKHKFYREDCRTYIASLPLVLLDSVNCSGWTPLMYACYLGHRQLVEYLVSRSCDVLSGNKEGRTPLMLAAMCGNVNIVSFLVLKYGKQALMQTDKRNFTALVHAVASGHHDVAETLLKAGASPNVTEHKKGYSALMIAAEDGNLSLVELLLDYGADYSYSNIIGDTARSVADAHGHDTIARCFLRLMMKHSGGHSTFPSTLDGPARADLLLTRKKMERRDNMTLARFLSEIGLDKYQQVFVDQEIDFQVLLTLTDAELKQVGISLLGPRRKITAAITRWKNEHEDQKIIR